MSPEPNFHFRRTSHLEAQLIQIIPEDRQVEIVEQNFDRTESVEHSRFQGIHFVYNGNLIRSHLGQENHGTVFCHQHSPA